MSLKNKQKRKQADKLEMSRRSRSVTPDSDDDSVVSEARGSQFEAECEGSA